MMTDQSYTLVDASFKDFMNIAGEGVEFSEAKMKFYKNLFFAGACSAIGNMRANPLSEAVMYDELADHACHIAEEYEVTHKGRSF